MCNDYVKIRDQHTPQINKEVQAYVLHKYRRRKIERTKKCGTNMFCGDVYVNCVQYFCERMCTQIPQKHQQQ